MADERPDYRIGNVTEQLATNDDLKRINKWGFQTIAFANSYRDHEVSPDVTAAKGTDAQALADQYMQEAIQECGPNAYINRIMSAYIERVLTWVAENYKPRA